MKLDPNYCQRETPPKFRVAARARATLQRSSARGGITMTFEREEKARKAPLSRRSDKWRRVGPREKSGFKESLDNLCTAVAPGTRRTALVF